MPQDADISIRRRALDLLYGMCDRASAGQIVSELLAYMPGADYDIREELVRLVLLLASSCFDSLMHC